MAAADQRRGRAWRWDLVLEASLLVATGAAVLFISGFL